MTPRSKILIVDDEQTMRMQLASMLATGEYDVTSLANGKELLEKLPSIEPDLIILDVIMPEMDGFEVARRLREHPAQLGGQAGDLIPQFTQFGGRGDRGGRGRGG